MNGPRRLALALLLLAAPAAAEEPAPPKEGPKPVESRSDAAELEALVKKAMPLVEKLRGGKFVSTPPVRAVTKEQFLEKFVADFTTILGGEERVAPTSRLLARLGILEPGSDMRALIGEYMQGAIAANYDPTTKKVSFLPGVARTLPLMVHELTHALDDQLFDMSAQIKSWDGNFDRALAYGALAEGDAESVEYRFASGGAIAAMALDKLREEADRQAAAVIAGRFGKTPPAVVLAFKSQYIEGLVFAEALRRTEKRNAAVDAAFRAPPASTEQVLHPEKYIAGEDPPVGLVLPAPPEGAKTLVSTTLGELGTRIVLLARGLPVQEAVPAAAGWGGDTVALVSFGKEEALIWISAWDTEEDAKAFHASLQAAFPLKTGEESQTVTRAIVVRGPVVEFVEAPLDSLPAAVAMARGVTRK
jgi:hypothetical protein